MVKGLGCFPEADTARKDFLSVNTESPGVQCFCGQIVMLPWDFVTQGHGSVSNAHCWFNLGRREKKAGIKDLRVKSPLHKYFHLSSVAKRITVHRSLQERKH